MFGSFDHGSRDGSEFWKRVQRFYSPEGYRSWSVGENLLWSSGHLSADGGPQALDGEPGPPAEHPHGTLAEIGLSALNGAFRAGR